MTAEPQIVNVLGEQVALNKTMFSPAESFLVSFDEKYKFPGMTSSQEELIKKLFIKLFSASSPFLPGQKQPDPPCTKEEKTLLQKTLAHRFGTLRDVLVQERKTQSNSLRLRQSLEHAQRLKEYLDFLESTEKCQDLDEGLLGESIGDLTDDQILELLRQFVFFILQGRHPLKDFAGRDPNPRGFVARLSGKPIQNFDAFLKEYRESKYTIPVPIEKVLQVTQLQLEAMKEEVEDTMNQKMQKTLQILSDVFPEDNDFWKGLDKTNLEAIVQRLLDTLQSLVLELEECNEKSREMEGALMDMSNEKDALEEEKEDLLARIAILEAERDSLPNSGSNSSSNSSSSSSSNSAEAHYEEMLAELHGEVDALEAQIAALKTREADLLGQLQEAQDDAEAKQTQLDMFEAQEAELEKLQATNAKLQEELTAATAKIQGCEELQATVRKLESQLEASEARLAGLRADAGELTAAIDKHRQEKEALVAKLQQLQEYFDATKDLETTMQTLLDSLAGEKQVIVDLLSNVQSKRAATKASDDEVLQQILALKSELQASEPVPTNMASMVGQILRQVQEEASSYAAQIKDLESQIGAKDEEIQAAKQAMADSNELLRQVRAGRTDLAGKGISYETDKAYLEDAARAIEAERQLKAEKVELEEAKVQLTAANTALQATMEALKASMNSQLEALRAELKLTKEDLAAEQEETTRLKGAVAEADTKTAQLQKDIAALEIDLQEKSDALEIEKAESAQRLADLEQKKIRECEERLATLRKEEEQKRVALLNSQGAAKGTLEARIAELLSRITAIEGERDGFKAAADLEKGKMAEKAQELEALRSSTQETITSLKAQVKEAQEKATSATGEAVELKEQLGDTMGVLVDLQGQVINDTAEKANLFEIISTIAAWITSNGKLPRPVIDEQLNTKYGLNRLLDAFLERASINETPASPRADGKGDIFTSTMSRCYLVFFMTYVYARHFPTKRDSDSSDQSRITELLKSILTELYKPLDLGIPGKLEPVGAGGVPLQLKSKYIMNILLPLIKTMEMIHESGKKGADFLKFSLLDADQLAILHRLHKIAQDKMRLAGSDIANKLKLYVIRRTGNVDDDIANLYLRFVTESSSKKEFPVVMYIPPDAREIPKFTFATGVDLEQYLSSSVQKTASSKVAPPLDKQLPATPVFSFNLLFYLFLFVVKDYLSSVEGELDKSGCPLPQILKSH